MLMQVLLLLTAWVAVVNTVPPQVPRTECRSLMDLVFVVDGSDSIAAHDYQKQRETLSSIIKTMNIGPNRARVGIVVYSSNIAQAINITDNKDLLTDAVLHLKHPRDGTNTDEGIEKMIVMFRDWGRKNVPYVSIVITDGISKNPALTAERAAEAKAKHVNMFAVGISHTVSKTELEAIASSPAQVLELTSFDQLKSSLTKLMKVVCPCPMPPEVKFAKINEGGRGIGVTRTYTCDPGYQPIGNPNIECLKDAIWSPLDFGCYACPEPMPAQGNALLVPGLPEDLLVGAKREYICEKGYTSPVPLFITCQPSPKGPMWTNLDASCISCVDPPVPLHAAPAGPVKSTLIGDTWVFACAPGYVPSGPLETTCVDDKGVPIWTPIAHACITCPEPPQLPYAIVDATGDVLVNARRTYVCQDGYHPTGPLEAVCVGGQYATHWELTPHQCIACGDPMKVPNARLETPMSHLVGTILVFSCLKGFQATGPIEQVCMAEGGKTFWAGPDYECVACTAPPVVPNAVLDVLGDTLVGSVRSYKCVDGYIATGPIEVGCIKGTGGPLWTSPEYFCVTCDTPPTLPNARMLDTGSNMVGHIREYECLPGYVPSEPGFITIKCIGEYLDNKGRAIWSKPSHACIACQEPPPIEHGMPEPGDNLVGASRRYKCLDGFHATGPIITTCLDNAQWSKPEHSCRACGPLPKVPFAEPLDGPFLIGTVRSYACHKGYVPDSDPLVECMPDAKWSPPKFSCNKCKEPYPIKNGVVEPGQTFVDTVRTYTCLPGFLATGPITSTCFVPEGTTLPDWSVPVHSCKDCGEPYPVPFATPVAGPWTIGAVQVYKCDPGFVPSGPPVSHCMQNAQWSPPEFKCINKEALTECLDLVSEMYKLNFDSKDYCAKPAYQNLIPGEVNGHILISENSDANIKMP